jgi:hypothetical protein
MSKKIKVGDKVSIAKPTKEHGNLKGEIAEITFMVPDKQYQYRYVLAFENQKDCYYFKADELKLASREEIIIYRDGNNIIALDKATKCKGIARYNPVDDFNFDTGAKLAFERLQDIKGKGKVYNGKVVCIKGCCGFETGRIYNVVGGKLINPKDGRELLHYKTALPVLFSSFEEINAYFDETTMLKRNKDKIEFVEILED